jgi:hypothetical protein
MMRRARALGTMKAPPAPVRAFIAHKAMKFFHQLCNEREDYPLYTCRKQYPLMSIYCADGTKRVVSD